MLEQELRIRKQHQGSSEFWEWEVKTFDPALVWAEDDKAAVTYGVADSHQTAVEAGRSAAKWHLMGDAWEEGWELVDPLP